MRSAVPLTAARRRYGARAWGLGLLALALVALVVVAQSPPSLRRGGAMLALLLVALCLAVSVLSWLWTWLMVWPAEGRRLRGAQHAGPQVVLLPTGDGSLGPLALLVAGGLLVGLLLWAFLNTIGLIGAPMLWIVVGTINLEVARRVRRIEQIEQVTYYETPVALPFRNALAQQLFVQERSPQHKSGPARRRKQGCGGATPDDPLPYPQPEHVG